MQLHIRARHLAVDPSIQDYISRKLAFSLDRFHQTLASLVIRLKDLNGPRGGQDKECQIIASLPGSRSLVVTDQDSNLYAAIDRAVDRFRGSLVKLLKRYQNSKKQDVRSREWEQVMKKGKERKR